MSGEHSSQDEPVVDVELEEGGDPVCWAHLVCPECGAVTTEGHRPGCELARETLNLARPAPDGNAAETSSSRLPDARNPL